MKPAMKLKNTEPGSDHHVHLHCSECHALIVSPEQIFRITVVHGKNSKRDSRVWVSDKSLDSSLTAGWTRVRNDRPVQNKSNEMGEDVFGYKVSHECDRGIRKEIGVRCADADDSPNYYDTSGFVYSKMEYHFDLNKLSYVGDSSNHTLLREWPWNGPKRNMEALRRNDMSPESSSVVYRVMPPQTTPGWNAKSIRARKPTLNIAAYKHILYGSNKNWEGSQWISASCNLVSQRQWSGVFLPLIAINLDKFRHEDKVAVWAPVVQEQFRQILVHPSLPPDEQSEEWKRTAMYAERAHEVLLRREICPDAYVELDRMVRVLKREVLRGNDANFPQANDLVDGNGNLLVEHVPDGAQSSQSQEWKVRVNGRVFHLRQGRPNRNERNRNLDPEAMRHVGADHMERQLRNDATGLMNRTGARAVSGICLCVMETHYRTPLFSNLLTVRVPLLLIIPTPSVA
eukprot:TRINITY_DN12887_c0_g1_i1.p1 TRINITY_DN12887_c0_g1~~TRINITY_DN12887_c0_g1_i1.p1  ORF type:complete len:471 (+),score=39.61 TRINITY_DN12887_c0_g1_i1:45-1415(+)